MKSVMEEASSIVKAIEKGWANAGKPKEFSVKIFEEPQKNFIGMTVKSAKIGIFFTEPAPQKGTEAARRRRTKALQLPKEDAVKLPSREPKRPTQEGAPKQKEAPKKELTKEELEERGPIWSDDMIASAKDWTTELLKMIDQEKLSFTVEPEHFHLKIRFDGKIYDDTRREKHLFASLSHLVLTMLKRSYKRPLKGYKIVLLGA